MHKMSYTLCGQHKAYFHDLLSLGLATLHSVRGCTIYVVCHQQAGPSTYNVWLL